jgi:hypothetical protein
MTNRAGCRTTNGVKGRMSQLCNERAADAGFAGVGRFGS